MKSEMVQYVKYTVNVNGKTYLIFTKKENQVTRFYIQREGYGIIRFMIGLELDEYDLGCTEEKFINEFIDEWVEEYDEEVNE
jgi:hypothetical protein